MTDSTKYHPGVVYTGKKRTEHADACVGTVIALYEEKQRKIDQVDRLLSIAITEALQAGATLREIATRLGVSPETVRKMGAVE